MANGHGGARPGAGRKPNAERFAEPLGISSERLAEQLPDLTEALIKLALGSGYQEKWVPAGTVTRKDVLRRPPKDGPPSINEQWEYQESEPDLEAYWIDHKGNRVSIWLDEKGKPVVIDTLVFPHLPADQLVLVERKPARPDIKALAYIRDRLEGKPGLTPTPDPEGIDLREALEIVKQRRAAYIDPDQLPSEEEQGEIYHGA